MRITDHPLIRFRDAYLSMASFYRPGAPGDGMGSITLTEEQARDPGLLQAEAMQYAASFRKEEDDRQFWVGVSNYETNQAFFWLIEAARLTAGGNEKGALRLMKLAEAQLKQYVARRKP